MNRSEADKLLSDLRECDETQGGVLRVLRTLVEESTKVTPPRDLTWVEETITVNAISPEVKAIEANPGWRLIAAGDGTSRQTILTYGWPWPSDHNPALAGEQTKEGDDGS